MDISWLDLLAVQSGAAPCFHSKSRPEASAEP